MSGEDQGDRSIWVVSDGRAGIERQALSLAMAIQARSASDDALGAAGELSPPKRWIVKTVRLQPTGWRLALPPNLWPAPFNALPPEQRRALLPPWPDLWIASGRRSIPYSRLMRQLSFDRTFVVQTQDPRSPLGEFDLVIPPEHDRTKPESNVFPILGAPTFFASEDIELAQRRFQHLSMRKGLKLLVSIGGRSKTHRLSQERIDRIATSLRDLAARGVDLWMTVSRRTPEEARTRFRTVVSETGGLFWETETRDGPNPYLAFLSMCDAALVTEDSANMIGDPAYFGKPVHLIRLEGRSDKFDRLHEGFIGRGAARWFNGEIGVWTYPPIREADRAAIEILHRMNSRSPTRRGDVASRPGAPETPAV